MEGVPNPKFKGFVANWNVIWILYSSGDPNGPMVNRERTCYFHWSQSMDKHTKQQIKLEMRG
jgi:hypothetical protein